MLVLDDVQWADADSLALLAHVTREVTRGRLLVVATVRPAERDLALGGLVIELFGWDDAEVGAALGGVPDPDFVAAVARRSGGNPFFVGELVRAGTAALRVPSAVRDVVRARIRRLPEPCRALLGAAAVLGRDVDAALLSAVTGVGGVLDDLRPALDDGVLDHPAGRVGLRFTHDLVRESVLADLGTAEQARVHLAVVAALTPSADDPDVVAELAHHALAALPAGDRVRRHRLGPPRGRGRAQQARLRRGGPAAGRRARRGAPGAEPGRAAVRAAGAGPRAGPRARRGGRDRDVHRGRRAGQGHRRRRGPRLRGARSARGQRGGVARRGARLVRGGAARASATGTARSRRSSWPRSRTARCSVADARAIADASAAALAMAERLDDPAVAGHRAAGAAARAVGRRRQRRAARARRPPARARRAHRRPGGRSVGQAVALRRAAAGRAG